MKTDIKTILDLLQQQQVQNIQATSSRSISKAPAVPERLLTSNNANMYGGGCECPSVDQMHHKSTVGGGPLMKLPPTTQQPQQKQSTRSGGAGGAAGAGPTVVANVQRSISQPECANERNLFA